MKRHIALIGFMGSGKSTVARIVGQRFDMTVVDIDDEIEAREGMSVADIFAKHSESYFRQVETDTLRDALRSEESVVIACGGGVVTRPENIALLNEFAIVVYLNVDVKQALARIDDVSTRPLLAKAGSNDVVFALMQSRMALYEATADVAVGTSQRTAEEVTDKLVERVREAGYDVFS